MPITKLDLKIPNEEAYVRLISGLVSGGLTKREMTIIILLLKLQKRLNTKEITQDMKEQVRLSLNLSSQTMHNYWNKLKSKKVIHGTYNVYQFNSLISHNVELKVRFLNEG